MCIKVVIVTK